MHPEFNRSFGIVSTHHNTYKLMWNKIEGRFSHKCASEVYYIAPLHKMFQTEWQRVVCAFVPSDMGWCGAAVRQATVWMQRAKAYHSTKCDIHMCAHPHTIIKLTNRCFPIFGRDGATEKKNFFFLQITNIFRATRSCMRLIFFHYTFFSGFFFCFTSYFVAVPDWMSFQSITLFIEMTEFFKCSLFLCKRDLFHAVAIVRDKFLV